MDGHKHSHLTITNRAYVAKIAKELNLPVRSYKEKNRRYLKKLGIITQDHLVGWHPKKSSELLKALKKPKGKVIELICHPGYQDPVRKYSYNQEREEELKFLKSLSFKKVLRNFICISYKKF